MLNQTYPRTPWPPGFPPVAIHCGLKRRDAHPDLAAAKAGDHQAASRLVGDLLDASVVADLAEYGRAGAVLLPVTALETTGYNAIPDAMTGKISAALSMPELGGAVVQSNRVGHTRASGWHRLVTPAAFAGPVTIGARYVLVDDHIGMGGTLANLRGHVEAQGAVVVGMTTLTESRDARVIALRSETLAVLRSRHGQALEDIWQAAFGHGLDCLTDVEAAYLARQLSVEVIRDRMAEAAEQTRHRGIATVEFDQSH